MPIKELSSSQNPIIKDILELKTKASKRRREQRCIIEGLKEIEIALASGIELEGICIEKRSIDSFHILGISNQIMIYTCSSEIMDKITIRDNQDKILAIAKIKPYRFDDVRHTKKTFVMILEGIEKPGNLGALMRTADASGVDLILCTEMQTDIYNHNVIRNSLGCVFSKPIIECTNSEALAFCREHNIHIFATFLHEENDYYSMNFKSNTAFVFGTESTGISSFWKNNADQLIKIPMLGHIDSMNVSNSASILLYELVRQRHIH